MLSKYTQRSGGVNSCRTALLNNANIGGENVHRGAVLGAVLGARVGHESLKGDLIDGLFQSKELEIEINQFVDAVMGNQSQERQEL